MPEDNSSPVAQAVSATSKEARGLRRVIWAMTVILAVSLAVNLLLAYKIKGLNDAAGQASPQQPSLVGASVPPLKATRLDGRQDVVSYAGSDRPVVLYVFAPQCLWCARNMDNFKTLLSQKQDSFRFVGLALREDGVREYVAENKLDLPIYYNPAEEAMRDYKFASTPQTIVVSPEGKVLQNWVGAYSGRQQDEVEKYFGVHLPGLATGK
jgi:thioredoxin-related protein